MTISEERFMNLEKKVDIFKDDVYKNDLVTVKTLERVEILLKGLLTKKGAIGYGAGSGGIIYLVLKFILGA